MAIGVSDNGKSNKKKNDLQRQTGGAKTNTNLLVNFPQEVKSKSTQSNTAQTAVTPLIWNRLKNQGTTQLYSPFGSVKLPVTTNTTASTLKHTKPGATTTSSNKTLTQSTKVVQGRSAAALWFPTSVKNVKKDKNKPKKPDVTAVTKPEGEGSKQPFTFSLFVL